jgi:hypothetical protein
VVDVGGLSITVITVIAVSSLQAASTLLQKRNLMHLSTRKKRALLSLLVKLFFNKINQIVMATRASL